MPILTVFFSMKGETITANMTVENLSKGHTAVAAEFINEAVGGDMFEIETVKTYIADHMQMIYEAKDELQQGIRPDLKRYPNSLDVYDTIFLGYPNWWGTLPMPVVGFLEHFDWSGKRIIPFNTSEGSGAGRSGQKIAEICKGAKVESVYELRGSQVDSKKTEIQAWAKKAIGA